MSRYDLVCVSHEPPIWWDSERGGASLDDLRMVYQHREAVWALPDDLWPDEYRRPLYFLRNHRNCMVRALHEDKSDVTLSEPLDDDTPPAAVTVTVHGAGGAQVGSAQTLLAEDAAQLGLPTDRAERLSGQWFELAGTAATEREGVRRAVAYLGDEELLRVLDLADQGYTVRGVFADPVREAVAVVVEADHLPIVAPLAEPSELRLVFNPDARYLDGHWWYRGRIKVQPPQ